MGSTQRVLRFARLTVLIDISVPFASHIAVWPGDTPFSCGWTARREDGASVNLGALATSAHAGTHADAPLHVDSGGAASESLPVQVFVGTVQVIALPEGVPASTVIDRSLLEELLAPSWPDPTGAARTTAVMRVPRRLLCRTGFSVARGAFPDAWPVLDQAAAEWLAMRGLRLWGTDAPSVDARTSTTLPVHHTLFAHGAYVLENLALDGVELGAYELLAQPLAVHGADAAPVRALLRRRP